jgi:hypothetical protein
MTLDPYALTKHDGKVVDEITHQAPLTVLQGSYQALDGKANDVSASAGTHDGGGVIDLAPWDWENKVRKLRAVGFAAWHRTKIPGVWDEHIHAVLIGNKKLAPSAAKQVVDFLATPPRDGLAGHAVDNSWHPSPPVVFQMPQPPAPVVMTRGAGVDALIDATRERIKAAPLGSVRERALKAALASLLRIPERPKR